MIALASRILVGLLGAGLLVCAPPTRPAQAAPCSANPYQKYYTEPWPESCNENITDAPMQFRIRTSSDLFKRDTEIVASGGVEADTDRRFVAFVEANKGKLHGNVTVVLNSYGGYLRPGMNMARAIRRLGFMTSVMPNEAPPDKPYMQACVSSCNFIFMGGVRRTVPPGSLFVTHRFVPDFKSTNLQTPETQAQTQAMAQFFAEDSQMAAGEIATFLHDLGIDPQFLTVAGNIPNSKPKPLSTDDLTRLHIITAYKTTSWKQTYSTVVKGYELNGTTGKHANPDLTDQLSLVCEANRLRLIVYYLPDPGDTIMPADFWDATMPSLLRRMTAMEISGGASPAIFPRPALTIMGVTNGGHLAVSVPLSPPIEQALRYAKRIGVSFDVNDEVWPGQLVKPSTGLVLRSMGFFIDLEEGRDQIVGFMNTCR
jgi:hypothetical protein